MLSSRLIFSPPFLQSAPFTNPWSSMTSLAAREKAATSLKGTLPPETPLPVPCDIETVQGELTRANEVAELCAYQRRAIAELESEAREVDLEIAAAEADLVEVGNREHALRGLINMRANAARIALETTADVDDDCGDKGGTVSATVAAATIATPEPKARRRDFRGGCQLLRAKRKMKECALVESEDAVRAPDQGHVQDGELSGAADGTFPVIGTVYSEFSKRYEAPRQSFQGPAGSAVVVLNDCARGPGAAALALSHLAPGSRVWLVYWFDRNAGFWREMVRPPRARGGWRVGVFATRSPHRPTPIGVSLADVVSVDGGSESSGCARIHVKGVDILDETPLVGFSMYSGASDSHVGVASGWLDDTDKLQPLYYDEVGDGTVAGDRVEVVEVVYDEAVKRKLDYVNARSTIDVLAMLTRTLSRMVQRGVSDDKLLFALDGRSEQRPFPLAGGGTLAGGAVSLMYPVGAWRVWYAWDNSCRAVRIMEVTSGIRREVINAEGDVDREVREHREFNREFNQTAVW